MFVEQGPEGGQGPLAVAEHRVGLAEVEAGAEEAAVAPVEPADGDPAEVEQGLAEVLLARVQTPELHRGVPAVLLAERRVEHLTVLLVSG